MINFASHQARAGLDGAREDFEQMLGLLVRATSGEANLVFANPGDWGIDVLVGDLSGRVAVWQAKYFPRGVGRSQQGQITKSFDAAVRAAASHGYSLERWVLCISASMDGPAMQWWQGWKARQERDTGVAVELWDETRLRELLLRPEAAHVRRYYYNPYRHDGRANLPYDVRGARFDGASGVQVGSNNTQVNVYVNSGRLERVAGAAQALPVPVIVPATADAGSTGDGAWRGGSEVWVGDRRYLLHDGLLAERPDPGHVVLRREALGRQLIPPVAKGGGYVWLRQAGPVHGGGNAAVKEARETLTRERVLLEQAVGIRAVPRVVQLVTEADRTTLAVAWPVTKRGEPCQTLRASFTPGVPPDPWHLHLLLTGVCGIAATLSELHARGVTHRNLTTDGIIVTGDGRFALRDLGLAGHSSRPGEGPADYQAPEQRPGGGTQRLGPATDVYQLASITYHLVTGRLPALRQPAPARSLNQELPEAVSDLLAAALGASPAGRPRMSEFRPTER